MALNEEEENNMNKMLFQVVGLFFLGSLLGQQASAGAASFAQFNTFSLTADGPFMSLGPGEGSSQAAQLSTTFDISMGAAMPFSLTVDFTGPNNFMTNLMNQALTDLATSGLCMNNNSVMHCGLTQMVTFEPGMINPGDIFTATGNIFNDGNSLASANSSFAATAAVPEPGALALVAIGLFGLVLARRIAVR
jgi:hypothetical protein